MPRRITTSGSPCIISIGILKRSRNMRRHSRSIPAMPRRIITAVTRSERKRTTMEPSPPTSARCRSNQPTQTRTTIWARQPAVRRSRKALTLKPRDPSILNNLALSLMDQKRVDEALVLFRQSSEIDSHNHSTHLCLARAYLDKGMLDAAKAACECATQLKPDDPDGLNTMGRILSEQNRSEAALSSFQKAIALKPHLIDSHNNMAHILQNLGRFDEAQDAYARALEIDPKSIAVLFNLADLKNFAPDDPHLRTMEELATDTDALPEEDQIRLHFALGKAYGDLKLHEKSFDHLLRGNALKRRTLDYDEIMTAEYFDRTRRVFTAELFRDKQGLGDPSRLPVFIVGMPRSGTTLVEQILASHPAVFGAGEVKHLGAVV